MIRLKKRVLFFTIFSIIFLSFPGFSSAHVFIKKSTPNENQVLAKPPKTISIQFSEAIEANFQSLRVVDMNGKEVDKGDSHVDPKNPSLLVCDVNSNLADGTYRIEWKVVSDDGHPVDGVIPFGVGEAGAGQAVTVKSQSTGYFPHLDLIVIRGLQFISGSIFIGLIFFQLFVLTKDSFAGYLENRYKKVILYSFWFLFISILLNLPLQATLETNKTWREVYHVSILKEMLTGSVNGKVWISQMVLLFLLFFTVKKAFQQKEKVFWQVSFFLSCCFLLAKSLTSHAFSSSSPFISTLMDFLHLLGASVWTGSLMAMIILLPLSRMEDSKAHYKQMVRSFFNWGIMIVLILTITGLYSSFMNVSTIESFIGTDYGRILLAKILLFLIMIAFAYVNFLKGKSKRAKKWGISLYGEIVTGTVVLILAAILTNLPTAASAPGSFLKTINLAENERVTLKIDPKVVGENHFEVTFTDQNNKPLNQIQQISLLLIPPGQESAAETINIPQVQVGRFYTQGLNLSSGGKWKVHLHILTRDLQDQDQDFSVSIGKR